MNQVDTALPVIHARVDPAGHLVEADARLHALNTRAGGRVGAPLAVPQLATLVRLAQRLRVLVSRAIVAADGDTDLDMWVRAEPQGDGGVRLTISGWRPRGGWRADADPVHREADLVRAGGGWAWETDAALCLTHIASGLGAGQGIDPAALLGRPMTQLFKLGEDDSGLVPILSALAMRARFDDQPAALRATGQRVQLSAVPRLDASGGFAGLTGSAHAIEADADGPRDQSVAFATRLDQALRAPLGRIIAHADSINAQADGPLRQDYVDYAADIATAGRHLLGLVDDLVDLQAIERPDFAVAAEPVDLADVARRAAGLLAVRAAAGEVRIDRPAIDEAVPATGEFKRVLQILVNLIGNAVRYSPPGGMVWIRAEQDGDRAVVVVADQGKGIAIDDQARIFEKFERVDPSEPGGSGLGLYIARRLARAMGGDITVDSAPGQGARFAFSLPVGGAAVALAR